MEGFSWDCIPVSKLFKLKQGGRWSLGLELLRRSVAAAACDAVAVAAAQSVPALRRSRVGVVKVMVSSGGMLDIRGHITIFDICGWGIGFGSS